MALRCSARNKRQSLSLDLSLEYDIINLGSMLPLLGNMMKGPEYKYCRNKHN